MGLLLPRVIANCSGNGNWMSISYCLQLFWSWKKKKGRRWGQGKKPLMPFRILVDIFKPERTDGLAQQERRRLVVSANDSAPANTNPAVFHTYSHSLLLLFPLPIAIKCYADALECYTIKEQDSDEWGGVGRGGGAQERKDEREGDSCFSASFSLRRGSLSPLPAALILKINSVSEQNKEIILFWQMLWGI